MPRAEFPEPEDIFDRDEAMRRRARLEAAAADHEAFQRYEAEQAAIRQETARQFSLRVNAALLIAEYQRAGVTPIHTNGAGVPTVSLSLLRWQGWTIEHLDGENILVAPRLGTRKPQKRESYDQNT